MKLERRYSMYKLSVLAFSLILPVCAQPLQAQAWDKALALAKQKFDLAPAQNAGCSGTIMTGAGEPVYEQIRAYFWKPPTFPTVTDIERMNGVEFRVVYILGWKAGRDYDHGRWREWSDRMMDQFQGPGPPDDVGFYVEKKNGSWSVEMFGLPPLFK